MEIHFWGTRGSLPASLNAEDIRKKIKAALDMAAKKGIDRGTDIEGFIDNELPFWIKGSYGTNTPCVEIRDGDEFVLCDAGSGIRDFGNYFLKTRGREGIRDFHIFLSHLHWDHIQGFPFFVPALIGGNLITVYGCHENMKKAFSVQNSSPFFPLDFKDLAAEIRFIHLDPGKTYDIAGFTVTAKEQRHPGKSYGYRFEKDGKAIVYSTDSEHKIASGTDSAPFVDFFDRADLLIFDAQYTLADAWTVKKDWGHSNNVIGVELAHKAGVKHLCLYHQEPVSRDEDIDKFLEDTKKLTSLLGGGGQLEVSIAWDGMVVYI
jgi:phosphoribosyl 1,2-cyclic phosphodiesterase